MSALPSTAAETAPLAGPSTTARRASRTADVVTVLIGFFLPISGAIDNLLVIVLLFAWLLSGNWRSKWENVAQSPVARVLLTFLLLAALGTAWGQGSGAERLHYFAKYLILLLPVCLIAAPPGAEQARRAAIAFGLGIGLTLLLSYLIWAGVELPGWLARNRDASNPVVFKLHITHSFFVALGALLYFVAARRASDRRWRWGLGLATLLAVGNLFIVQGRTGQVVLLVLVGYLFIHRFGWRGALAGGIALLGGIALIAQNPNSALLTRYSDGIREVQNWEFGRADQSSMGLRMQYATTSLRIIAAHPLTGVGTGGFERAYRQEIAGTAAAPSNNPHNQYLLTTAQLGLPGLLALLAIFAVLWRAAAQLGEAEQLLARGLLLAYGVGNLFNSFLLDHTEKLLFAWAIALLYAGLPHRDSLRLQKNRPNAVPHPHGGS